MRDSDADRSADLAKQSFDGAGDYELLAEIPPHALQGDEVRLELALAKSSVVESDNRQLGVVAERAALEVK